MNPYSAAKVRTWIKSEQSQRNVLEFCSKYSGSSDVKTWSKFLQTNTDKMTMATICFHWANFILLPGSIIPKQGNIKYCKTLILDKCMSMASQVQVVCIVLVKGSVQIKLSNSVMFSQDEHLREQALWSESHVCLATDTWTRRGGKKKRQKKEAPCKVLETITTQTSGSAQWEQL